MTDEARSWKSVDTDLGDYILDLQLSHSSPLNPKPQYDLALSLFNDALATLNRSLDPDSARRVRKISRRLLEMTDHVYERTPPAEKPNNVGRILADATARFDAVIQAFRNHPTVEGAEVSHQVGAWLLESFQHAGPASRPSTEWEQLFNRVVTALTEVAAHARSKR